MKQFPEENLPPDIQDIAERMNVDPQAIPPYELPKLPFDRNTSPLEFMQQVRPELLRLMGEYMYGEIPPRCEELRFEVTGEKEAFGGLGIRREIDIICRNNGKSQTLHMLLYIPKERKGKVPVFFGLNFKGNHACTDDSEVTFHPFDRYPNRFLKRLTDTRADKCDRGIQNSRWCFEEVLKAGFASATINYYEISPDRYGQFDQSVLRLFYSKEQWLAPDRKTGIISAWAWGISRGIDALESQPELDMSKLIVHGHSRLGKTALWAGANDQRITLTVSSGAGCCGAKLCHHYYGENFEWMDLWNNHWYCGKFREYVGRDMEYPVDQHFLLAAIAPRMVYIADAEDDTYADPMGEFLSLQAAQDAWKIFGMKGLNGENFPGIRQRSGEETAFFFNSGGHDFTPENWRDLLAFVREKIVKKEK
ncbi:MAG: hypothetical protein E7043_09930 [Lentisphaerae bacterium]|nr:hypothetical protein [Lentisphaerota bacterium]